ncbi:phage tail tube protein [Alloyangia pacifica]|uniref:phage tail tube protein n=1 Tax=Alloyangia pacifica TaxID=311180 RepID=UPI001CFE203C|nr:phage tail tube protein [Alloyangia pacifica]
MPDGMIGYGSIVRIGVGETPTWTTLDLLGDLEMPDEQVDEVEITHMKSPGRRKQFIAGLTDSGEVAIPMNYIPGSDTDVLLTSLRASREEVLVEITLTDDVAAVPETYSGFLKGYSRTAPINDKMTAVATFRLSEEVIA